jgi:predicted nucleic acid-binding protein
VPSPPPPAVLDASIAAAWCFEDEATPQTDALLDRLLDGRVVVPPLWHVELANLLVQNERRGRIDQARAAQFLALLGRLRIETDAADPAERRGAILDLARQHRLSAYDAAYLDVALRRALPLASKDVALRRAAEAAGVALLPVGG